MSRRAEQLLFLGDAAECAKWLPFVRRAAATVGRRHDGRGVLVEKVRLPGGWALIKVSRTRAKLVIYCEPGGVSYEFFTSEDLQLLTLGDAPGTPSVEFNACGRGSFHTFRGDSALSAPLVDFSSSGVPAPEGPDGEPLWPTRPCNRDLGGEGDMKTRPRFWSPLADYRQLRYTAGGKRFVFTGAGALPGLSSVGEASRVSYKLYELGKMPVLASYMPLVLFDSKTFSPAHVGLPSELWPPGDDLPTAASTYISDEGYAFAVLLTFRGFLYTWRIRQYSSWLIPSSEYVKRELPTPSWAFNYKGNGFFSSDARRFVTTPLADHPSPLTANGEVSYHGFGCTGNFAGRFAPDSPAADDVHKERAPGIVEYRLYIERVVAGGDEGIDLVVEKVYDEHFGSTGRYIVGADYLADDDRLPYPKDTLVMMAMDLYRSADPPGEPDGGLLADQGGGVESHYPDHVLTRLRSSYHINARTGEFWTEIARIPMLIDAKLRFFTDQKSVRCRDTNVNQSFFAESLIIEEYGYFSEIFAADLKTLSWATFAHMPSALGQAAPYLSGVEVVAYGEVAHRDFDEEFVPPEWSPGDMVECEPQYREVWAVAHHETRFPGYWMAFSMHPKGHWSIASQPFQVWQGTPWATSVKQVDIINVRRGGKDSRFTHKDLYNSAFSDARDYDYYVTTKPGGTFRTFGLFRDG